MSGVPGRLARTVLDLYGERGAAWLDGLPALVARYERRWSVVAGPPFPGLSYNYVAPAVDPAGRELVLKLGVVHPELLTEIEALRLFDGQGCVRLLAADLQDGALLLERLSPGTPLSALDDDEQATVIAAGVMRRLWRPLPAGHDFPTFARWAAGLDRLRHRFDGGTGPLPADLVGRAESLFAELLASAAEAVLLHGDLHHDNILAAGREPWLAVDPKGVAGEPAFEVGPLLFNPIPRLLAMPQPGRILARRVDQLAAELDLDRARVAGWGLARAVLAAWWSVEDNQDGWDYFLECARLLAAL